ncbi:MAG: Hsp20/alpha crystallin family protein [bacterium]
MDKKRFLIVLISCVSAVFLASFLAFWLIFGHISRNYYVSNYNSEVNTSERSFTADKIIQDQNNLIEQMDKDFNQLSLFPLAHINMNYSPMIKTENTKDTYKITINLRSFNNDPKNVDFKINNNMVNISAKYQSKDKKNSSSFSQSFNLTDKVDEAKIKEDKKNGYLIITIPKIAKN